MNYQRAQFKQEVKQAIKSTTPRPMWVTLVYTVLVAAGSWLLSVIIRAVTGTGSITTQLTQQFANLLEMGYDPTEAVQELLFTFGAQLGRLIAVLSVGSMLLSVLTSLWSGLMGIGYQNYCRRVVRLDQPKMGALFSGFPMIGKAVLTRFLVWVFSTLWTLLFCVGLVLVVLLGSVFIEKAAAVSVILWILGYIAFIVLELWLTLRYAMTNYVLLDTGDYGLDAITASKTMMKGHKWQLFVLFLSFIGWYLIQLAVFVVAAVLTAVLGAGAAGSIMGGSVSYGALAGLLGGLIVVWVVAGVAIWLLNLWLQPYITCCEAKFYYLLKGEESQPALNGFDDQI